MKALRIYENAVIKVEEVEIPIIKDNMVKVRVKSCGICGSDIPRVLDNKAHYYPIILGHEFSGIIAELGANVNDLNVGDHVVGAPLLPCHECVDCKNGDYSLCKNYNFIGSRTNGAMAEYVILPKENVKKIDSSLDFHTAALVEPLTVVLHGFKQNSHLPNKNVAVLGMGTIGLLSVQYAKFLGAKKIAAFVRNEKYNHILNKIGNIAIIDTSKENWQDEVKSITDGRNFDFVYETAGSTETMKQSFLIAGNKAHVCLIGTPKKEMTFSVDLWEKLNRKEFFLTGSWMSYSQNFPGIEWDDAIRAYEQGSVKVYPEMIHKIVPLNESASIFDDYKIPGKVKGRTIIDID
ncbi:hypothetical protein M9Y10_004207 [Tritrichomonas musculus]|uniref:Galactitol-1-phosphate 5-dehydrogenase n=1 Tax=Tritrichomonas musculus TaxID=1915356 RepID=A0ABR2JRG1_9EUKA